jgi:hypothetical protein
MPNEPNEKNEALIFIDKVKSRSFLFYPELVYDVHRSIFEKTHHPAAQTTEILHGITYSVQQSRPHRPGTDQRLSV